MQIASPFGIPLRLHWSFVGLYCAMLGYFAYQHEPYLAVFMSIVFTGMFVSVILHEFGHVLAARRYGIGTQHVTLYPWGGVAAIERMPEDPDQEIVVALAGPAVNFVLAGIAGWGWLATHHPLVLSLVLGNLMMGLFNLIPAFPMDGGRVLRSLLARWMGWESASRLSIKIGRVFAWLFVGVGLWSLTASYNPSLLLVGAFLHVALNAEKAQLVAAFWEKTTGNPAWWDRGDGSKPAGLVVP